MEAAVVKPKIVMRGAVGVRLDVLGNEHLDLLKRRLTLTTVPYKDNPATVVHAYEIDDEYIWLPRYFDHLDYWPKIRHWEWVAPPLLYEFKPSRLIPDPARKQTDAIAALTAALRRDSAAIGVLPTGTGKTLVSLETARNFNTPIGVLIYAGHQIDNWIKHAELVLGVPKEDVGIVKEDRCDLGKPVTIISIQTVMVRELPEQLFRQIGFICADECHHFGAAKWSKVVSKFRARYRLGVSADPVREDGLDPIIRWHFGKVGYAIHVRPTGERPLVCMIRYPAVYEERKYIDWKNVGGKWVPGSPNSMKYDKLLMKDKERNEWLVSLIMDARSKGRRILILARHREHIEDLHDRFIAKWATAQAALSKDSTTGASRDDTRVSLLWGGLNDKQRAVAQSADVIFATHGFAREALNLPQLDTLVFATPPGDPLQPVGRLRDKGPVDRKSLLALDPFEPNDYSFKKAMRRRESYISLGLKIKRIAK